jgi:tetratricopeptide (TPR) repeat protein
MNPALHDFRWQLSAAEGYLMLGMAAEALEELEQISAELNAMPEIVLLRLHVLNKLEKWEAATALGQSAIQRHPEEGDLYILTAYAKRRFVDIAHAKPILLAGESVLKDEPAFHYNLACYECQLADLYAAKSRLQRAFELDKSYQSAALEDEDLEPLREWIASWLSA